MIVKKLLIIKGFSFVEKIAYNSINICLFNELWFNNHKKFKLHLTKNK